MADKIRLLPEVVANQIAAGEVVNRPASVVKEMMENAIDAGASRVMVNFRDGGRELIQVVDNGCGMSVVDARMAFDRHATSKIRSAEDIYALHTFGFRGEALASIAAVAQVELRTRRAEDEMGTEVEIHGGSFVGQKPVMCDVGTQFFVRNLFYNVPARRRFLEKSTTSAKQIKSEFQRVALCYPEIEFELYANDAPLYRLSPSGLAGRIVDLVGRSIKQNLLEVDASTSIASLKGYIGRPAAAKQRNTEQYLFVNGRYFKSPYLITALMRGYEKLIPHGAQPSFFLFLEIDPSRIDVNIHPQKTEVKFADEEAVWQIVNAAVRETLAKSGAVPMMDFERTTDVEIPVLQRGAIYSEPQSAIGGDYNPFSDGYIDPSAPDPNIDFKGFDVPYYEPDSGQFRDVGSSGASARSSFGTPSRVVPFGGGLGNAWAAGSEFDDIPSTGMGGGTTSFEVDATDEDDYIEFNSGVACTEPQTQQLPIAEEEASFSSPILIGCGYLGALLGGRFVVVDLRRAYERILYDEALRRMSSQVAASQQLLFPDELVFSREEYQLLADHEVELAELGFDLVLHDGERVELRGLPSDMGSAEPEQLLYELLQSFAEPIDSGELRRQRMAAILAANGARRAPKVSTAEEAQALLDRLASTSSMSFTPTGKSVLAQLTIDDIKAKLE